MMLAATLITLLEGAAVTVGAGLLPNTFGVAPELPMSMLPDGGGGALVSDAGLRFPLSTEGAFSCCCIAADCTGAGDGWSVVPAVSGAVVVAGVAVVVGVGFGFEADARDVESAGCARVCPATKGLGAGLRLRA